MRKVICIFSHILRQAPRGGCLCVRQAGHGQGLGARFGDNGDGGHDPAPGGGVPGPWEQHRGVHLARGQHEEEGGGGGHDEGQPGLHQDQPQPVWAPGLCGDGQQRRQVAILMNVNCQVRSKSWSDKGQVRVR